MTNAASTDIAGILSSYQYRWANESDLQDAIEQVLITNQVEYEREFRLSRMDRPDFFIDGLVIEVKVVGSVPVVARQLQRYARHESVQHVLLVSAKRAHRQCEGSLQGKPVKVIVVGGLL